MTNRNLRWNAHNLVHNWIIGEAIKTCRCRMKLTKPSDTSTTAPWFKMRAMLRTSRVQAQQSMRTSVTSTGTSTARWSRELPQLFYTQLVSTSPSSRLSGFSGTSPSFGYSPGEYWLFVLILQLCVDSPGVYWLCVLIPHVCIDSPGVYWFSKCVSIERIFDFPGVYWLCVLIPQVCIDSPGVYWLCVLISQVCIDSPCVYWLFV